MNDVSEQQMAERLAPADGPGREAAEVERQKGRQQALFDRALDEQRRYGDEALATMTSAWLSSRKLAFGSDPLTPEEASELRLLTAMADRMARKAGENALQNLRRAG